MGRLTRRDSMIGLSTILTGLAVSSSEGTASVPDTSAVVAAQIEDGTVDRVYLDQSVSDLPEPDQKPALAITNDGLFEWPTGGSE